VVKDESYTINDAWASDNDPVARKSALRRGTYSALNVYFQTNLSAHLQSSESTTLLGYCSLPSNDSTTLSDYSQDGCNVLAGSMPYCLVPGYNEGKTAIHEIGHWFGLFHTFQGSSCVVGDRGDYIDDTSQQSVATYGFPNGEDSCPHNPGLDPIHKFMDYSTDAW